MSRLPMVAVVGRANIGKSTLVNRILGRREAIEHPEPGVTRDRQGYRVEWGGLAFQIVDTGGWEPKARGLAAKVVAQAERAAAEADLILMVTDALTGVTEDDLEVAKRLRKVAVPVLLVANKVDSGAQERELWEMDRLGLGAAIPVSALHGRGSGDLLDVVGETVRALSIDDAPPPEDVTAVAIVGRPNVGKSSIFNRLVGDERSIVDALAGTTRDTVDTLIEVEGKRYRFVDTAGMRKRAREAQGPEYYGLVRSMRAIDDADVAVHVVDASVGATEQDQRIARRVTESGRAAIVVLNKWDLVDPELAADHSANALERLGFRPWTPVVRTSAETKRGIGKIVPAIEKAVASWEQRVPTAALNTWLREVVDRIPLGDTRGRPTRIRYCTQTRTRPPSFVLFASGDVTDGAQRALERRMRERFGFEGSPIRFTVRKPSPRGKKK